MEFKATAIAAIVTLLVADTATADMISPSHNCSKPVSPSVFASDSEKMSHRRQLDLYKQCLSAFIREQEKEAKMHSDAARAATSELSRAGN